MTLSELIAEISKLKPLERGRFVKTQLNKAIGSKLSPDNTLCTDAWRAFSTYAKSFIAN